MLHNDWLLCTLTHTSYLTQTRFLFFKKKLLNKCRRFLVRTNLPGEDERVLYQGHHAQFHAAEPLCLVPALQVLGPRPLLHLHLAPFPGPHRHPGGLPHRVPQEAPDFVVAICVDTGRVVHEDLPRLAAEGRVG